MQTAEEHIANSEHILQQAIGMQNEPSKRDYYVAVAQVEATLAVAAATLETTPAKKMAPG